MVSTFYVSFLFLLLLQIKICNPRTGLTTLLCLDKASFNYGSKKVMDPKFACKCHQNNVMYKIYLFLFICFDLISLIQMLIRKSISTDLIF